MKNNSSKLEVLLITDGELTSEGYGIRRTLVNIFGGISAEVVCPSTRETSNLIFKHSYFRVPNTFGFIRRFGSLGNRIANFVDISLLASKDLALSSEVKGSIAVVSSNLITTFIAASKLLRDLRLPYVVYLMDETDELEEKVWIGGSGKDLVRSILQSASGWISVSEELLASVSKRLNVSPKRTLILHNPVSVSSPSTPLSQEVFTVGFAGSIWEMQKDPLEATAKAIHQLRKAGEKIELVLHTPSYFWEKDKEALWAPLEARWGGEIPYDSLHKTLSDTCDLLLVTASFLKRFSSYSATSLQTKITDYMASGRPIYCVAPEGSVVSNFVKKWRCGFVQNDSDVDKIASELRLLISSDSERFEAGIKGFEAASNHFSLETARKRLDEFLKGCV